MPTIRPARVAGGLTAVALAATAVAGCGSATRSADARDTRDAAATTTGSAQADAYSSTTNTSACEVLTPEVAEALLGTVAADATPAPDTTTADLRSSTCVRTNSVAGSGAATSVSLLMRVATSTRGAESNRAVFADDALPQGAQPVSGYGDKAFWNPSVGQLNVLSKGNWYVLTAGPLDPRRHTLAETARLADAIRSTL